MLLAPGHTAIFSGPFSESMSLPSWTNGYLLSRQLESAGSQTPNVILYDAQGAKIREVAVWIPGSVGVILSSAVVAPGGGVVAIGIAEGSDAKQAFFVARIDGAGNLARVIRTNPYVPIQVCAEADGTVWTAGGVRSEDPKAYDDAEVFRHFDFDRGLIEAYVPHSSFGTKRSVAGTHGARKEAIFGCSSDRVVLYSGVSNQYVELTTSDHSVRRWKIDRSFHDLPLNGFALTSSGELYSSLADLEKPSSADGLYYLEHDDSAGTVRWSPIASGDPQALPMADFDYLFGADGESLVYSRRDSGLSKLHWSPLAHVTVARAN